MNKYKPINQFCQTDLLVSDAPQMFFDCKSVLVFACFPAAVQILFETTLILEKKHWPRCSNNLPQTNLTPIYSSSSYRIRNFIAL